MATTTNFGFETPDDTDLVKDGALAIRTALDDVDGRFGDDANYPDQIVNVVSGVSRPLPFAMQAGTASGSYSASTTATVSVTFAASRFTQAPLVFSSISNETAAANVSTAKAVGITTSGFTARWDRPTSGSGTVSQYWVAVQMTSAASAG